MTPARNEADNLRRLGASLIAQTWRPQAWIVVDNGSTDETGEVIRELEREHEWIQLLSIEGDARAARGSASVRAFNAGATSAAPADLVTNADADISFTPEYFAGLREEFERRPRLGIGSGLCYEPTGDGGWVPVPVPFSNLRGAALTFRAGCLAQLMPLEARVGWDGIACARANLRGWETAMVPSLDYFHHRLTGARDANRFFGWAEEGAVSHYMWYRPLYLFVRAFYRVLATRDLAAAGLAYGYVRSALRRTPKHAEQGFRELVHERQGLRALRRRFDQTRGSSVDGVVIDKNDRGTIAATSELDAQG